MQFQVQEESMALAGDGPVLLSLTCEGVGVWMESRVMGQLPVPA